MKKFESYESDPLFFAQYFGQSAYISATCGDVEGAFECARLSVRLAISACRQIVATYEESHKSEWDSNPPDWPW